MKVNKVNSRSDIAPILDGQDTKLISGGDYVWADERAEFTVKALGGSGNPSWNEYLTGFQGLTFSGTAMNQVWLNFCINHDIALNTKVYPHIHWMPLNDTTGVVRWGIEYMIARDMVKVFLHYLLKLFM